MTKIIKTVSEWQQLKRSDKIKNKKIGFVPTMGALHEGHLSLIRRSNVENGISVVSIFVNPTQFNDPSDLEKYPRTFESDVKLLRDLNVDYLFYPDYSEIYADHFKYKIIESDLSQILCGKFRPGHFEGVLTVVMKLLNIIRPDKAYFGEKDYQQYLLIDEMCKAFFLNVAIILCPIVREADGLALSSRNMLLSSNEKILAQRFPQLLKSEKSCEIIKNELEKLSFKVDYIEEIGNRRFGAVHIGKVRLIDNVEI
ncbi:MAG: pantoate--beta-alanine ligase [Melioribacter sp.]|nr:pantoate--beta-alanine ligase [Melioribacter sp.]